MGGGLRFHYPKWVWSPTGGWWPEPKNWKRNTALAFGFWGVVSYYIKQYSDNRTVVYRPKKFPKDHIRTDYR